MDIQAYLAENWPSWQQLFVQFWDKHVLTLIILMVGICCGILLFRAAEELEKWRERRKMSAYARKMRDGQRKQLLHSLLADIIIDGLDDAVHCSKISNSEHKYLVWHARQALRLVDLFPQMPRKVYQRLLKRIIAMRLGDKKPVPIPDETGAHWKGEYDNAKTLDDILVTKEAA